MIIFFDEKQLLRDGKRELHRDGNVIIIEGKERIFSLAKELRKIDKFNICKPDDFGKKHILNTHDQQYIQFLETIWDRYSKSDTINEIYADTFPVRHNDIHIPMSPEAEIGYYSLGSGTTIDRHTWCSAYASAQSALGSIHHSINHNQPSFTLCRPAGHHATKNQFGGLCFLNNSAIAANYALSKGLNRICILDIDVHHGNGTQSIFYDRNDVLFVSLHVDPSYVFPYFSGFEEEIGSGCGKGYNINYILPKNCNFNLWMEALLKAVERINHYFPEVLIVSLGFDTHKYDPVGHFTFNTEDYFTIGKVIKSISNKSVFMLEGGYDIDSLAKSIEYFFEGYAG